MKVIYGIGRVKKNIINPVLAIGVFDGLHEGHQELLRRTINRAKKAKGTPMVMTFSPHPVQLLRPEEKLPLLISLPHRLKLLQEFGIQACLVVHFTRRFSRLSPEKFVDRYLVGRIKPKEVFVGDDFRFGQDRIGDITIFSECGQRFGFKVNIIPTGKGSHKTISSTNIRHMINEGNLKAAQKLLGRRFSILGSVIRGDLRGRTLGYPTANLNTNGVILPPRGVYCVKVKLKLKEYFGVANVGFRPSFRKKTNRITVEVYLFDFKKNIYGQEICVEFIRKIRDEKKFESKEDLIDQIRDDESVAREFLESALC